MGIATTTEQAALQRSIRSWAETVQAPDLVRAAEPHRESGTPPTGQSGRVSTPQVGQAPAQFEDAWAGLAGLGVLAVALPEDLGGAGGRIVDAAVALEEAAAMLVPGPLVPTLLAGLLLARHADPVTVKRLLPRLADGSRPAAVALGPGRLRARWQQGGGIRVDGRAVAVLGASPQAQLVLAALIDGSAEVWFTLDPGQAGLTVRTVAALDFSRPLSDLTLIDVNVPADQILAGPTTTTTGRTTTSGPTAATVTELAAVLAAAEMAGVADWCLRTAVEHARVREQFGRPIGSFQAIKHLCAQMLCRREQAVAVAWDAARAADGDPDQRPITAAVAAAIALDAAVTNAKDCIQVLGGIGFTWEHDAHLYLRRALATRQWLGGTSHWRRRVAAMALAGQRRRLELNEDEDEGQYAPDDAERQQTRNELTEIAALPEQECRIRLADNGYLMPHWPAPYGSGASAVRQLMIDEELRRAGLRRPDLVVGGWALPTIIKHGTDEQQDTFVRPTLRGEIAWCQLFSEPEAGSDLASLRTRAQRVSGGWRLTGQKVWTSGARQADWAICLARTDPAAPRHHGISYFLVEMSSPGLLVRPLREITGDSLFNQVFLDDVFVPDDRLVGPVNGGWRLARTTLSEERVALGRGSALGEGLERLLDPAQEQDLERLGELVGEGTAVALIGLRATVRRLHHEAADEESPDAVLKLLGVQHRQAVAEAAYERLGPQALALNDTTGPIADELLRTRCLSIAGGTTQILLTQAAERLLGLPREPVG
jgi:alkylation response protein AidB-like acyl-CoA dehydrogenase